MKGSITWKGATGATFTAEAEYTVKMVSDVAWLDGYEVPKAATPHCTAQLVVTKDGMRIDSCSNAAFWSCIEIGDKALAAKGITHRLWGCTKVAFTSEVAAQIDAMLKNVIAGGKAEDPEVAAYYAAKAAEKADKERRNAEWVIEEAKRTPRNPDGTLMNDKEAAAWQRSYNNAMNDGAEGYVPDVITQEQYDAALKVLSK